MRSPNRSWGLSSSSSDVKFRRAKAAIAAEHEQLTGRRPPITPDHYKQRDVPYIPEHAGYTYLMNLPEGENIGKAINNAMKTIEEKNRELAGILPQEYSNYPPNHRGRLCSRRDR